MARLLIAHSTYGFTYRFDNLMCLFMALIPKVLVQDSVFTNDGGLQIFGE